VGLLLFRMVAFLLHFKFSYHGLNLDAKSLEQFFFPFFRSISLTLLLQHWLLDWNVKGMGSRGRRRDVKHIIKDQNVDIILTQEMEM
jgi:hypothetical protein